MFFYMTDFSTIFLFFVDNINFHCYNKINYGNFLF